MGDIVYHVCLPDWGEYAGSLVGNGSGPAGVEYPGSPDIDPVVELVVYAEIDVVATVVFIRETFAVVDAAVFEPAVAFGDGIGQPAGRFPHGFLCHYF